jgi:peptidoglycan hydrolase-like protein with peptidoglycan-binding domain
MKTLKIGSRGPLVSSLQLWLNRFGPCLVDGDFGKKTHAIVCIAQRRMGLMEDGKVGPASYTSFMSHGWLPPGFEQPASKESPYPNKPDYKPLTMAQKIEKFGNPGTPYKNPNSGGPIKVSPKFRSRIRSWPIGIPGRGNLRVDVLDVVDLQWAAFFRDLQKEGLQYKILSYAGSWVPRYVRGSTTTYSSHAFGTALDFNAPQNWLGAQPAKKGEVGSLIEIIPIAERYKIYWGGWFSRVDGMHFESTKTDEELGLD